MNSVHIVGRLCHELEVQEVGEKQTPLLKNCLAVRRDKSVSDFIDVQFWGKAANIVHDYCKQGHMIGVDGSIQTSTYPDKNTGKDRKSVVINVSKIHFLNNKDTDSKKELDTSSLDDVI